MSRLWSEPPCVGSDRSLTDHQASPVCAWRRETVQLPRHARLASRGALHVHVVNELQLRSSAANGLSDPRLTLDPRSSASWFRWTSVGLHGTTPHTIPQLVANVEGTAMSLNGLDHVSVTQAYQLCLAEAGGW